MIRALHRFRNVPQEEEIPRAVTALLRSSQGYVAGGEPHS